MSESTEADFSQHGEKGFDWDSEQYRKMTFVVRSPGMGAYKQIVQLIERGKEDVDGMKAIVEECLLHPAKEIFNTTVFHKPALIAKLFKKLIALSSAGLEDSKK